LGCFLAFSCDFAAFSGVTAGLCRVPSVPGGAAELRCRLPGFGLLRFIGFDFGFLAFFFSCLSRSSSLCRAISSACFFASSSRSAAVRRPALEPRALHLPLRGFIAFHKHALFAHLDLNGARLAGVVGFFDLGSSACGSA